MMNTFQLWCKTITKIKKRNNNKKKRGKNISNIQIPTKKKQRKNIQSKSSKWFQCCFIWNARRKRKPQTVTKAGESELLWLFLSLSVYLSVSLKVWSVNNWAHKCTNNNNNSTLQIQITITRRGKKVNGQAEEEKKKVKTEKTRFKLIIKRCKLSLSRPCSLSRWLNLV